MKILVNRCVANGLTTFGYGEGCFQKPNERSKFSMWEVDPRHFCQELQGAYYNLMGTGEELVFVM